ncbi:DNA primase [Campylobacter lari]|nr:DNA primase [Campylobacter lari]
MGAILRGSFMKEFNIELLNEIDIKELISNLGGSYTKTPKLMQCPNKSAHKDGDKHPSMGIKGNSCKCFACGFGGNPVSLAKEYFGDFKKACEYLHETWNIPYKNGQFETKKTIVKKQEIKKMEYFAFDLKKSFKVISLKDFLKNYNNMNERQKLKMAYSFVYRFSLTTNQDEKISYYHKRKISKDLIENIGFIGKNDIKKLNEALKKYFPIEDLQKFNLVDLVGDWKYGYNTCVVPSFDLYTNLVTGFMLRSTNVNAKVKEVNVSNSQIIHPLPFNLTYDLIQNATEIYITEGHIDGLSLKTIGKNFISFSGIYSYKEEELGLLREKKIFISFDQDDAGKSASNVLAQKLEKANIQYEILKWDPLLGKDVNDLLVKGKLKK